MSISYIWNFHNWSISKNSKFVTSQMDIFQIWIFSKSWQIQKFEYFQISLLWQISKLEKFQFFLLNSKNIDIPSLLKISKLESSNFFANWQTPKLDKFQISLTWKSGKVSHEFPASHSRPMSGYLCGAGPGSRYCSGSARKGTARSGMRPYAAARRATHAERAAMCAACADSADAVHVGHLNFLRGVTYNHTQYCLINL